MKKLKNIFKNIFKNRIILFVAILHIIFTAILIEFVSMQINDIILEQYKQRSLEIINILNISKNFYKTNIFDKLWELEKQTNTSKLKLSLNYQDKYSFPYPNIFAEDIGEEFNINSTNIKFNFYDNCFIKNGVKLKPSEKKIFNDLMYGLNNNYIVYKNFNNDILEFKLAQLNIISDKRLCEFYQKLYNISASNKFWVTDKLKYVTEISIKDDKIIKKINFIQNVLIFNSIFFGLIYIIIYIIHNRKKEKSLERIKERIKKRFNDVYSVTYAKDKFNQAKFENIFKDISNHLIYTKTNLFGEIIEVSNAFCKLSGYTEKELIGQDHKIVRHEDMNKDVFKDMWNAISNNKIWNGEIKNKRKDGSVFWTEVFIFPIFDNGNVKNGYMAIRYDITEKKERELKHLANELKYKHLRDRRKKDRNE